MKGLMIALVLALAFFVCDAKPGKLSKLRNALQQEEEKIDDYSGVGGGNGGYYVLGKSEVMECPQGYKMLSSASECADAIASVSGSTSHPETTYHDDLPRGCYYSQFNGYAAFNEKYGAIRNGGAGGAPYQPVCEPGDGSSGGGGGNGGHMHKVKSILFLNMIGEALSHIGNAIKFAIMHIATGGGGGGVWPSPTPDGVWPTDGGVWPTDGGVYPTDDGGVSPTDDSFGGCTFQCHNGGTCLYPFTGEDKCTCAREYSGADCSEYNPTCVYLKCQNGGSCYNYNGTDQCACPHGYSGYDCSEVEGGDGGDAYYKCNEYSWGSHHERLRCSDDMDCTKPGVKCNQLKKEKNCALTKEDYCGSAPEGSGGDGGDGGSGDGSYGFIDKDQEDSIISNIIAALA